MARYQEIKPSWDMSQKHSWDDSRIAITNGGVVGSFSEYTRAISLANQVDKTEIGDLGKLVTNEGEILLSKATGSPKYLDQRLLGVICG
jgi:hypothetical protein